MRPHEVTKLLHRAGDMADWVKARIIKHNLSLIPRPTCQERTDPHKLTSDLRVTTVVYTYIYKLKKCNFQKLKASFCTAKETVSKSRGGLTKWENIFASYASNGGQITRVREEL